MTRTCRRPGGLAVLVAAAIGLAACGSGASTPQVASLGTSSGGGDSGGGSSTAGSSGNATQLVDEWAACVRTHGDPSQADPVIDSAGDIEITMRNVSPEQSQEAHDSSGPCGHYLAEASSVLRNGQPPPQGPSQAQLVKYAECMRANGVPDYPDPGTNGTTSFRNTGVDPNSPSVQKAGKVCAKKTGMPATYSGATEPGVVQVRSYNGNGAPPPGSAPGANG
jgi:hypothetical protein